jgi:hypothetical protein
VIGLALALVVQGGMTSAQVALEARSARRLARQRLDRRASDRRA